VQIILANTHMNEQS